METHGPILPLLLGEDVLWKLMDGCKGTHVLLNKCQLKTETCKQNKKQKEKNPEDYFY